MIVIAIINIKDNYISGDIYLKIRNNKETPLINKVDKLGIVKQVNLALIKCYNLYKDASYKVI
jgi:hydrogenase maturation factor